MNLEFLYNLIIFIGICVLTYIVFRNINFNESKEGLENNNSTSTSTTTNGVAGGAATYAANIKEKVIKIQDTTLISKYRADYENVVINMDDLVNNLMLQVTLNIDQSKPEASLSKLVQLNLAKGALNNVMKFIDKS
jgi:hypothetical protein